jgi:tRNA U34 5-carboxymethylaminomethyl modifying enzyme MnmG/GidA
LLEYFAKHYEVAVVGAGHAGIEAALAAARLGCREAVFAVACRTGGERYIASDTPLPAGTVWNLTLD